MVELSRDHITHISQSKPSSRDSIIRLNWPRHVACFSSHNRLIMPATFRQTEGAALTSLGAIYFSSTPDLPYQALCFLHLEAVHAQLLGQLFTALEFPGS